MDAQYTVRSWDTDKVLHGPMKLAIAKRHCRGEGHTGELVGNYYVPVAYVANERGECVYNPRFAHLISAAVSGLINRYDSNFDSRTA